jgi:hypothetical protein
VSVALEVPSRRRLPASGGWQRRSAPGLRERARPPRYNGRRSRRAPAARRHAGARLASKPTMARTDPHPFPPCGDARARRRPHLGAGRRATLVLALAALASGGAFGLAEVERTVGSRAAGVQMACVVVALLWVAIGAAGANEGESGRPRRPVWRWVPPLLLVAVACALRYWMLTWFPFPDRTGFEELEMGADASRFLATHMLELELRFTQALAALGIWLGGPTVTALRTPFHVLGYARLAVLVACLRGLNVRWWPTAFVVLTAAVSRWFVIGAGVAYEDYSATLAMLLLTWCLIRFDPGRRSAAAWGAAAGVFAGVLMFENVSFRFVILLAAGWLLWLALAAVGRERSVRSGKWRPLVFFAVTFTLVAAPMLVDVVHRGARSIFFEAFIRYAHGRTELLAPAFSVNLRQTLATLAGLPVRISFYLAPEHGHAVHPFLGLLLMLGLLAGLVRPRTPFVRALALAVVLAIVVCCATTNFFSATRLAPVFSLLLLAAGSVLEDLGSVAARSAGRDTAAARGTRGARGLLGRYCSAGGTAVLYCGLSVWMVVAGAHGVKSMAADPDVRREYANDQYVTATYLRRVAKPRSRVVVCTAQGRRDWSPAGNAYWVYAAKRLRVKSVRTLPEPKALTRGTLLVIEAERRALTTKELGGLRALGRRTKSAGTLRIYRGRGGRPLVASVCVGCRAVASPGS